VARKWWTLLAACVATFMLLLDITVVNVALPAIRDDLGSSFSDLQWVVDAYALTLAALLLTAGSLADLLGRRRVFAAGLVLFAVASLLCGLAATPLFLNLARALQGVGGAIMFATSLALIAQEFQGRERGVAFGAWGATTGAAVAIGPLVGGVLTEALGWEWIFFINIPIGAAALLVTLTRLAESRNEAAAGVDWAGVLVFSGALFALVYGLIRAGEVGWTSAGTLGLGAVAAALLVIFILIERRVRFPMFQLELFRKPTFTGAAIVAFSLSASMFAMFLYLVLYVQNTLGYSPLEAGVRFLPVSLLAFVVAPVAGRLSATFPVRALMGAGLGLVGVGLLLMGGLDPAGDWQALLAGFLVAGVGIGLTNPPLASTAIGVVSPERSGMASGINSTFRQVGIATGIAALGSVLQSRVETRLDDLLAGAPAGVGASSRDLAEAVAAGGGEEALAGVPAGAREQVAAAAREAFVSGLNDILLIAAAIALTGAVCALALVRRQDFVVAPEGGVEVEGRNEPAAVRA
jgi:EmrB/QacA subfamily drug resistance transporter